MYKFHQLAILIIFTLILFGFKQSDSNQITGSLIYSNGSDTIKMFNFITGEIKIIYKSESQAVLINSVSKVSPETLLLSECLIQVNCKIKILNISNGEVKTIGDGRFLKYLDGVEKLFFYNDWDIDQSEWLWVADKFEVKKAKRLVKAPNTKEMSGRIPPPLKINSDNVLILGEDYKLSIYELSSGKISYLGWGNCFPKVWRSKTKKVICQDFNDYLHYQVDLQNNDRQKLPDLKKYGYGMIYIPSQDSILGIDIESRIWPFAPEIYYTFIYNFSDSKKNKIKNGFLDSGYWLN